MGVSSWVIWLIILGLFFVFEVFTTSLVTVWFMPGAAIAALCAFLNFGISIQIGAFIIATVLFFPVARNIYKKRLGKDIKNVNNSYIGKTGLVTKTISQFGGRIIIGDINWEAIPQDKTITIPEDSIVQVVDAQDLKLVVIPVLINNHD